jgi:hypothetical protein
MGSLWQIGAAAVTRSAFCRPSLRDGVLFLFSQALRARLFSAVPPGQNTLAPFIAVLLKFMLIGLSPGSNESRLRRWEGATHRNSAQCNQAAKPLGYTASARIDRKSLKICDRYKLGVALFHLVRRAIHCLINRCIHIVALRTGLDRDIVFAIQNHIGEMTALFDVQDQLNLNNLRKIETESCNLILNILLQHFCNVEAPSRYLYRLIRFSRSDPLFPPLSPSRIKIQ